MTTELMPMTTQITVHQKPEDQSEWPVVIDSIDHPRNAPATHAVNGYAELHQLMEQYPDARCHLAAGVEVALRRADIERAMAFFKASGRHRWTSAGG